MINAIPADYTRSVEIHFQNTTTIFQLLRFVTLGCVGKIESLQSTKNEIRSTETTCSWSRYHLKIFNNRITELTRVLILDSSLSSTLDMGEKTFAKLLTTHQVKNVSREVRLYGTVEVYFDTYGVESKIMRNCRHVVLELFLISYLFLISIIFSAFD